ncbi:pseudaminic acid synthase [Clostridium tetani]|nr:pseudaminic acid synthase [Clostridium tetani]
MMNSKININGRIIGDNQPCYIIAEMSGNHAGSYERAVEIIREAKNSGADCIKIQTYTPDTMTIDCNNQYFSIKEGTWEGENLYNLYKKAYTPWEWQEGLKKESKELGLDFLSTPFDKTSVDFLESLDVNFYKIASFELVDIPLIKYIASKNKPIIMSTGMGTLSEIEEAVNAVKSTGNKNLCLLKCSSSYPAIPDDMNLMTMKNLNDIFEVPVGLSDHSLGSIAAVTAVAMGAKIIEKHFCLSRNIDNPDASFSMEPQEFKNMVKDIRAAERAIGKVSYRLSDKEVQSKIFRRSIFIVKDIKKGDRFTEENIRIIRPGYGLKPKYYDDIIGKTSACDMKRGTPLSWDKVI